MAPGDELSHSTTNTQVGFFSDAGELGGSHPQFNEICTALYEREVISLAHSQITNLSLLKRRMGGLPYHVKAIARHMVNNEALSNPSPLRVDTHNGSWYAKQSAKCPGINHLDDSEKQKIHFIHFNHTNDVIRLDTQASKDVIDNGYSISKEGDNHLI